MGKKRFSKKEIAAAVILLLACFVIFLTMWLEAHYDKVEIEQILYQMKSPSTGVHKDLLNSLLFNVLLSTGVVTALVILLYLFLSGSVIFKRLKQKKAPFAKHPGIPAFLKNHALVFTVLLLIGALVSFGIRMELFDFVKAHSEESTFIEDNYVTPDDSLLHFPEQKRNLVYIFLESMESTYADPSAGPQITECYIPELEALAEENVNFSNRDGFGGALSFPGTTWTAAAMVAQTSGVTVKVSLEADTYGMGDVFIPGVVSIGQLLEQHGYTQVLLLGSNAEFHGREMYFSEHGNYEILDTDALKATGRLPEDYENWWGFEDEKLFAYAKEELTRLAEEDEPFNFTMLTADTHFPDGCPCDLCEDTFDTQYANVLACSSRQVAAFVAWIQEQPFYENTTIVISGDHLTMDKSFMDDIDPNYTRTVYNCIINSAVEPVNEKNRKFGTFDLFPTTLAAMGVEIDGERLGLGTNLFSDKKTVTERYGYNYVVEELKKQSDFYDTELLEIES